MKSIESGKEGYTVFLVRSTGHAFHIEKILIRIGITCKLIPVPRHLGSDCGVCVRVKNTNILTAKAALKDAKAEVEGIHEI
jgi:hypothetical protein